MNIIDQDNKYLIVTSKQQIVNIEFNLEDLRSRSKNFLLQNIEKPDDELMFALILKNFSDRQVSIEKNLIDYIIKRIEVNPKSSLSYQYHMKRSESWTIIEGQGIVTLDGVEQKVSAGESIKINKEAKHRILNPNDTILVFIEVQTGTYFGEDDIVRIEDDYNRI